MLRRHMIPIACAVAALASAGAGVIASLHWQAWDTSALVRMHERLPVSKLALKDDPTFRLRTTSGFYDGAYFYAIARDPLATGQAHHLLDQAPYYWGHPAYGWLAWLASGGGQPRAVPDALLAVGLLSIFIAGAAASLLARALGWSPWGGLVVALNPGLVFAVYADTSESLGAALLLLGLAAYALGRRGWAIGLFAALCFVKEPLVLVPLAIAAWELWRTRRPPFVAAAVVPAVLWWVYLRIHLGAFPFGQGSERLTAPLLGWKRALLDAASQSWNLADDTSQMGQASVALIIVVGLAILVAGIYALRLRSVVAPAFLAIALLYACITPNGLQYPKDLIRELALVLTLLPFVLAARASPAPANPA
jgi:multisubunit Na+/H+ antiporter MnhG subunit